MTEIAQTASITLITAVPGSGKTLRAVWYMRQALEKGETVFACNVAGLNLDGVIDFPDPTKWPDLPTGSVLVVDECQKFFRAERGVPSYIAEMETIRHLGIRLILLTQHPALIHTNIRALVGLHEHIVRQNGKTTVTIYSRSRVIDNVRSDKALQAEDHHSWSYPTDCFGLYKSAEIHTFKRTIPHKYRRAALMLAAAFLLFGGVAFFIRRAMSEKNPDAPLPASAVGVLADGGGGHGVDSLPKIRTAADYAARMQPLIADAPFTAPAFVNRPVLSEPQIYCISSGHMSDDVWVVESCSCLTEQGTRYDLEQSKCADVSRSGGRYNPYLRPAVSQERNQDRADMSPTRVASTSPVSPTEAPSQQQARYGAMRGEP